MGVFSGDTVNLNTCAATGTFASENVGTGITVTVTGLTISGAQAGDYTLTAADDDGQHHAGHAHGLGHHGREQGV